MLLAKEEWEPWEDHGPRDLAIPVMLFFPLAWLRLLPRLSLRGIHDTHALQAHAAGRLLLVLGMHDKRVCDWVSAGRCVGCSRLRSDLSHREKERRQGRPASLSSPTPSPPLLVCLVHD